MKKCWEYNDLGWPIRLDQAGPDNFTVTYGLQVREHLRYSQAATELGSALMHALACESQVDNAEAT